VGERELLEMQLVKKKDVHFPSALNRQKKKSQKKGEKL